MGVKARLSAGSYVTSAGKISHFTEKELHQGSNWFERASLPDIEELLIDMLEEMREDAKVAIHVSSGVRSPRMNKKAGGDPHSLHLTGGASDQKIEGVVGWAMVPFLERVTLGGRSGRWGVYHRLCGGHSHLDVDTMRERRRFVCMPKFDAFGKKVGTIYRDLEAWCLLYFPEKAMDKITIAEANKVLGF